MMGLRPLEFIDCLTDSPFFRENLHLHEKELDKTSQQIKGLIRDVKELVNAASTLSRAQRNLANSLSNFTFETIGGDQTDDEIVIAGSLKEFGRLLLSIEDERDRMLERASATFIEPIEKFRRDHIGGAKEGKKKFDKETAKFCQNLERHLNLSTKKSENHLQEADATLEMEQRHFVQASLEYVLKLQEVQERKKFEFVETILSFMYGWLTFYHQGHEVAKDFKSFMTELQIRLQKTRENYKATQDETENLMKKMLEARKQKPQDPGTLDRMYARQGYLFLMEKKAFGTTWIKHFCQYRKETRQFIMTSYNQTAGKLVTTETVELKECIRRMSDSIDKRFCFDIIPVDKSVDKAVVYTFQALSEEDRKLWLDAMDGKDPIQLPHTNMVHGMGNKLPLNQRQEECLLDELGFAFVVKCIDLIESRGLDDQGLYRVGGVSSKVTKLIQMALDRRKLNSEDGIVFNFDNPDEWEIRTITSALKNYFRNLPEPLMTYRLHNGFIASAKQENRVKRIEDIHSLVHRLPKENYKMLHMLMRHLLRVANNSEKNLMTISNLGVCFGPTLLRPEEESVAAIMDIKFGNVVVEILIENCDKIFTSESVNPIQAHRSMNIVHGQQQHIVSIAPSANYNHVGNIQTSQQGYPRVNTYEHNTNNTYATIPVRGITAAGQVFRSNSHDQLAFAQPYRGRLPYQQEVSYPRGPPLPGHSMISYPPSQTQRIYPHQHLPPQHHPNGPPPQRPFRPLTVYNPWNSQAQPSSESHNNKKSPVTSSGSSSGESSLNQQPQQNSPRSSPSQIVGTSTFYPSYPNSRLSNSQLQPPLLQNSNTNSSSLLINESPAGTGRRVRTLYACVGENVSELSFEPNVIVYNVRPSREPGWLEGNYNGKEGLIPENYVQFLD